MTLLSYLRRREFRPRFKLSKPKVKVDVNWDVSWNIFGRQKVLDEDLTYTEGQYAESNNPVTLYRVKQLLGKLPQDAQVDLVARRVPIVPLNYLIETNRSSPSEASQFLFTSFQYTHHRDRDYPNRITARHQVFRGPNDERHFIYLKRRKACILEYKKATLDYVVKNN